jgi:hypothetical protein
MFAAGLRLDAAPLLGAPPRAAPPRIAIAAAIEETSLAQAVAPLLPHTAVPAPTEITAPAPMPTVAPWPQAYGALAPAEAPMAVAVAGRSAAAPPVIKETTPASPLHAPVADRAAPPAPPLTEVGSVVALAQAAVARPMLRGGAAEPTDAAASTDEAGEDAASAPSPDPSPVETEVSPAVGGERADAPYRPSRRPQDADARFAALPAGLPDFGGRPTPRPVTLRLAGPRSSGGRGGAAATFQSAIVVSGPILLGVTTRNGDRLALIRNAGGAVRRMAVGQAVDGWTVAAIHDDRVQLRSARGRETLRVPRP